MIQLDPYFQLITIFQVMSNEKPVPIHEQDPLNPEQDRFWDPNLLKAPPPPPPPEKGDQLNEFTFIIIEQPIKKICTGNKVTLIVWNKKQYNSYFHSLSLNI